MRCYFLRHGIAAGRDEWQGSDFDRPLTERGRDRMAREAKAIAELGIEPDAILTSPLVRAKETAEIVAKALKRGDRLAGDERLGLSFDASRFESIVRDHHGAQELMLVGHEPGFSQTVGRLIGGATLDFKKGALARVDLATESHGALVWLLPPKVLCL
jgi:phosphohistidine phosphatase